MTQPAFAPFPAPPGCLRLPSAPRMGSPRPAPGPGRRRARAQAPPTGAAVGGAPSAAAAVGGAPAAAGPPSDAALAPPPLEAPPPGPGVPQDVLNCCVKIYATHAAPDYSMPWSFERQTSSTSTGFVVEGRRILTCAHCVEHATVVQVKRRGCDRKCFAKVAAVGKDCDTAILTVGDADFWAEIEALAEELGELPYLEPGGMPALQEEVAVIGYPSPGNSICVTQGVASRAEVTSYSFSSTSHLLTVQIDSAINSGSSGGCVIDTDMRWMGIAFQSIDSSEGEAQGYFVPQVIVQHFLDDVAKHGQYTGFPETGFRHQKLENQSMRRALGIADANREGILVQAIDSTAAASNVLKRGDIVVSVDGVPVSNSGTVPFPLQLGERIDLSFVVTNRFVGEPMKVGFLRDGVLKEEEYNLPAMGSGRLVPNKGKRDYMVWGGLVFLTLSEPYLTSEFGGDFYSEAPLSLLNFYYHGRKEAQGGRQEVVVLAHVLTATMNAGYEDLRAVALHEVNGKKVNSLHHLAQLLGEAEADETSTYNKFELDHKEVVIIDKALARSHEAEILLTHAVPAACLFESTRPAVEAGKPAAEASMPPSVEKIAKDMENM